MLRLATLLVLALTAQQVPANTALIVGRVIDQLDGKPIGGAVVEVFPEAPLAGTAAASGPPRRQMTDALGRFVFRELPAGVYTVRARTGGNGYSPSGFITSGLGNPIAAHIPGGYGQRRPGGPFESIPLANGQILPDLVVRLWRGGALNGAVVDDLGDPVVDTIVGAVYMSADGRLVDGPTTRTDDRGRYRLSALQPGRYIVFVPQTIAAYPAEAVDWVNQRLAEIEAGRNAGTPQAIYPELIGLRVGASIINTISTSSSVNATIAPRRVDDAVFLFQTTFHPQATSLASATAVVLGPSEERLGIDVSMQPVRAATVSGTLVDAGAPASGVRMRLLPAGATPEAALFEAATTVSDAQGRFTFPVVPVGNYTIETLIPLPVPPTGQSTVMHAVAHPGGLGAWLSEPVGVGPDGVRGLLFTLKNSYSIKAQVEFNGATARPTDQQLARFTIGLNAVRPRGRTDFGGLTAQNPLGPSAAVSLGGIPPGRYVMRLQASPAGSPWRLQSVTVGGREVNELPIDVSEDLSDVRIVFTDQPASVGGRVTFSDPAGGSPAVVVFPTDRRLWSDARAMTRRFRLARTSPAGDFVIADMPPGDYYAVALVDEAAANWPDTAFLTALAPMADSFKVVAGNRAALSLTVKTVVKLP